MKLLDKITQLSEFKLHSIEQPIQKNNTDRMADLCKTTPLPIALDEVIGVLKWRKIKNDYYKNNAAIHHFET
jgi:hypothetical protein